MSGFHEEINSNGHILYWLDSHNPIGKHSEELNQTGQYKILGMDLDWTIIRPIKGKIHPLDEHDWQFLYQKEQMRAINDKIASGYKLVIFTNQGGLLAKKGGNMDVEGFKTRWNIILEQLATQFNIKPFALLISLYDDYHRKPCCGMWEFLEKILHQQLHQTKKHDKAQDISMAVVDRAASLYVGDMAGRQGDYSASDLQFAMNLGVDFQVPETFYYNVEGSELASNKTSTLIKQLLADEKLFNPNKPLSKQEMAANKKLAKINAATKDEIIAGLEDQHMQSLIIFVGSPASGKSSWYASYLKHLESKGLVSYLGMDTFNGTLTKFHKEIEEHLKKGKNVIVDNTNGTEKSRSKLATLAKGVNKNIQVLVVHFTTDKQICMHLNALRTKQVNICELQKKQHCGHNVPAVAIHTYWKYFEQVDIDKELGIDVVYTIGFEPRFSGLDEKIYRLML